MSPPKFFLIPEYHKSISCLLRLMVFSWHSSESTILPSRITERCPRPGPSPVPRAVPVPIPPGHRSPQRGTGTRSLSTGRTPRPARGCSACPRTTPARRVSAGNSPACGLSPIERRRAASRPETNTIRFLGTLGMTRYEGTRSLPDGWTLARPVVPVAPRPSR